MERLVTNRLQWWMENKGIFNKFQSGFRKNISCEDHILRLQDEVHKALHSKHSTLACFLDLEKAFDTMWIQGLLYKMQQIDLKGQICNWISNFLTKRSIQVRVGTCMSRSYDVTNDRLQGSVISPLLFLLLVNDMPASNNGVKISLFADDCAV